MYNQKVIFCLVAVLALAAETLGRPEPFFGSWGSDGGSKGGFFEIGKKVFGSWLANRKSEDAVSNEKTDEKDQEITDAEDSGKEDASDVADKTEEKDKEATDEESAAEVASDNKSDEKSRGLFGSFFHGYPTNSKTESLSDETNEKDEKATDAEESAAEESDSEVTSDKKNDRRGGGFFGGLFGNNKYGSASKDKTNKKDQKDTSAEEFPAPESDSEVASGKETDNQDKVATENAVNAGDVTDEKTTDKASDTSAADSKIARIARTRAL